MPCCNLTRLLQTNDVCSYLNVYVRNDTKEKNPDLIKPAQKAPDNPGRACYYLVNRAGPCRALRYPCAPLISLAITPFHEREHANCPSGALSFASLCVLAIPQLTCRDMSPNGSRSWPVSHHQQGSAKSLVNAWKLIMQAPS